MTEAVQDFFCGGHTTLPDGDVLWVGGTDPMRGCAGTSLAFFGHPFAWRLDVSTPTPTWSSGGQMNRFRWYPTATLLPGGEVFVAGHDQEPMGDQWLTYDRYDAFASTPTWLTGPITGAWPHWREETTCPEDGPLQLLDYPRLHVLSSGELMQSNSASGELHHPHLEPTRFMNLVVPQLCSNGERRWEEGPLTLGPEPRVNGNSVHLITEDGGQFTEVVYIVGGANEAMELESECVVAQSSQIFATTEKMVNPGPSAAWEAGPTMNSTRVQQNTVILLDGSLFTVGGHGVDTVGTCKARLRSERYETEEVFGDPNAQWKKMAKHVHDRRYHSTAVLLPDGRVVAAGGESSNSPDPDSQHSVEIYSPPYFFQGARPVIDETSFVDPHVTSLGYGGNLSFPVTLADPSDTIDRVALVRGGAATHAFDMSQRYVELEILGTTHLAPGGSEWLVEVLTPVDELVAPAGFYMLTVVDDSDVPSSSVWIRLQ